MKTLIGSLCLAVIGCSIGSHYRSEFAGAAMQWLMIGIGLCCGYGLLRYSANLQDERAPGSAKVAFWVVVVLWLYVLSYFLQVDRYLAIDSYFGPGWNYYPYMDRYPLDGSDGHFFQTLYVPLNQIDRWLRPTYWTCSMYADASHFPFAK